MSTMWAAKKACPGLGVVSIVLSARQIASLKAGHRVLLRDLGAGECYRLNKGARIVLVVWKSWAHQKKQYPAKRKQ